MILDGVGVEVGVGLSSWGVTSTEVAVGDGVWEGGTMGALQAENSSRKTSEKNWMEFGRKSIFPSWRRFLGRRDTNPALPTESW